jgi:hypothetical protein
VGSPPRLKVLTWRELLDQSEVTLEIWQCFICLAALYIGFMALAFLGLKINSRRV